MCLIAATYGLVRLAYGLFLPDIQEELGLSAAGAGYISSGSSLIYCAAAAAGFGLGRRSPRALVVAAAVTACGGAWGMAAAGDVTVFGVFAVISSAGAGFASPAMVSIVARNVVSRRIDTAQAVVNAGTGPGLVGAAALALALSSEWRIAWAVIGVLTAGVAVAVLVADRRPGDSTRGGQARPPWRGWVADHRTAIAAATLMGASSSAVWTFGRSLLVDRGVSSDSGTASAWLALGVGASAVIATAHLLTRLSAAAAWMLSCAAMTAALLVLAIGLAGMPVALSAYLLYGWGFTAATAALIAWTTEIDAANSAAGTAMLFVALVFGQAIGSSAVGFVIAATTFSTAFVAAAVVSAVATGIAASGQRRHRVSRDGARPAASPRR